MINKYTNETLLGALEQADRLELETVFAVHEKEHAFSSRFERKMKRLLRSARVPARKYSRLKTGFAVCLAVVLLLSSALSVTAVRKAVFKFVAEVHKEYTHIYFDDGFVRGVSPDSFTVCLPSYIPDGFELKIELINASVLLVYQNEDEHIDYTQDRLGSFTMNINTEGVELEELEFRGLPAGYYSNLGMQNLFWYDEEYFYMVSSTLDKETLFKIAESVEEAYIHIWE